MLRVQNESLLLSLFMAILLVISACETGGAKRDSIEDKDMIEGEQGSPSGNDTIQDNDTSDHRMDSLDVSELRIEEKNMPGEFPLYKFESNKEDFLPAISKRLNATRAKC